jgi:hypothetical protein
MMFPVRGLVASEQELAAMPCFVQVLAEDGRSHYLNVDQIRTVEDRPDEQSVRVEFDANHRLYLDRQRAHELLKLLAASRQQAKEDRPA